MHLIDNLNLKLNYNILFFVLLQTLMLNAQQEIYKNSFEATPLNVTQYSGNPTMHSNITSAVWSNDGYNFNFSQETGDTGNALGLSINGGSKYTLTLTIAAGQTISISGLNFWGKKEMANMSWTVRVNNFQVGTGNTTQVGDFVGPFTLTNPMNNLSGTVNIEIDVNGNGNGTYSLDDFTLYGSASNPCPEVSFMPVDNVTCENKFATFYAYSIELLMSQESETYQWKVLDNGAYVPLTNAGNYLGVDTPAFSIQNTPLIFDGNKYICEVTSGGCTYILGPITLKVYPKPQPITIQYNN
ncbi:hypothetical protein [Mesonia maritima]|uniref:Ig-like domain-containing protein n=1 Tax=Mesonia maritima TaxID=1793873 RepID=A0ABU1K8I5_9FLAO|nr:hypothetical protein [Mesonia maritima]MDR6301923.1 hypothetical protein [Mesonia maritima]